MASQHAITQDTLRARFAISPLARMGWTFERAMAVPAIATTLQCGARAAERSSHTNRTHPHWTERSTE